MLIEFALFQFAGLEYTFNPLYQSIFATIIGMSPKIHVVIIAATCKRCLLHKI